MNQTINSYTNTRDRIMSQGNPNTVQSVLPKNHIGPFNVKCLFMESATILQRKIT